MLYYVFRNALERQFLQILQFNTNVPSSVYAKYYFDLRALADKNEMDFSLGPLSTEKAVKLEVCKPTAVLVERRDKDFSVNIASSYC